MKYFTARENIKWSRSKVQQMCIQHSFYTCGDNEDYEELFFFVEHYRPTLQNLILAAQDIYEHSDIEELMRKYGGDEKEIFEEILFLLNTTILTTYQANETQERVYGIRKANDHVRKKA